MKKFHFYLVDVEPEDVGDGGDIGYYVRDGRYRRTKKNTGRANVVKVTLWLSQKPLPSITKAKIHGIINLPRYSPKQIIKALKRGDCCDDIEYDLCVKSDSWFARAKVEKVK